MNARKVATAGVIAAVYGAVTFLVIEFGGQLAWGPLQFRPSEALVVVAAFTPAALSGLAIGSALANLTSVASMGAVGLLDVVFGSLATLLGAIWTWRFRRRIGIALLGPVIFNALIVPAYLPAMLRAAGVGAIPLFGVSISSAWWLLYLFGVASIGVSEAVVVYALGLPLVSLLRRLPLPGLESPASDGGRGEPAPRGDRP